MRFDHTHDSNNVVVRNDTNQQWLVYLIVFGVILLSLSSVLFNTYLRQDDLSHPLWNRSDLLSHGDLYSWAINEFRPLSIPVLLFGDFINYEIERAWVARLLNITLISTGAILCYHWMIKFNINRVFTISFSILLLLNSGISNCCIDRRVRSYCAVDNYSSNISFYCL